MNSFNQFFPACCQHVWQSGIMFSSLKCQQSFDRCQSPFSCWNPITDILPCLSHVYKNNSEEPCSCFIIFWANEDKMIAILWYLQECCNNLFVSFVAHPLCFLLRLYKGVPMLGLHLMAIIIFVTKNVMNYLPSIIVDLKLKKIRIYLTFRGFATVGYLHKNLKFWKESETMETARFCICNISRI